jgi:hypothetical protein
MKSYYIPSLIIAIFLASCKSPLKTFEKRDRYFDNSSVLGLNAINADYNYYTKAILEYLLIKEIIDGNSNVTLGTPKFDPASKEKVTQVKLFPQLEDSTGSADEVDSKIEDLRANGVRFCFYDLPKELTDLTSGFQFNHYIFKSTNRAAMQAFGIVDGEINQNSLYIITDYLQYEDINCTGLPTIRYAVGMRAQFRLSQTKSESELKGIGSLAGLAAQVETNQKNVNITIKTIGITGLESRLSIPSNTSFDVKTYSDYEKIIQFIRNLKDKDTTGAQTNADIKINPQIIPVMDDYRTTIEHTFHPMYESIELLETKIATLEKDDDIDKELIEKLKKDITDIKLILLFEEIEDLKNNRETLIVGNRIINDYSTYTNLYSIIKTHENNPKETLEILKDKVNLNYSIPSKIIPYRVNKTKNVEKASVYETKGFQDLINQDVTAAINNFIRAENSFNGFHQVYEIAEYLKSQLSKEINNELWKTIYLKMLTDFNQFIPDNLSYEFNKLKRQ